MTVGPPAMKKLDINIHNQDDIRQGRYCEVKQEGRKAASKAGIRKKTRKLPVILVVEDSVENLYFLSTLFKNKGYRVTTAANGQEALKRLKKEPPDLILSDILMPVMDGFLLLQQCKADPALSQIPFVFLTGAFTDNKDEELGLKLGADAFLRKPIEPDDLVGALSDVLSRKPTAAKRGRKPAGNRLSPGNGLYNATLMQKLEQKMQALEEEIVERKKTEEARAKSEEQYRLLFETMDQGVMFWNEGKLISANPAAARILGIEPSDLLGRTAVDPMWKGFHEDGSNFALADFPLAVAARTGRPVRDVTIGFFSSTDDKMHWIRVSAIPQFHPGEDRPYQVYATLDDITDRFFAFKALQESESRMSAILENTRDAIWSVDRDFHLIAANSAALRLYKMVYESGTMEGVDVRSLMQIENRDFWTGVGQRVFKGEHLTFERQYEWLDETHHLEFSLSPIVSPTGGISGAACFASDITGRKNAEHRLQKSEELFRKAVQSTTDIVWEWDIGNNHVEWHGDIDGMLGYLHDEFPRTLEAWGKALHPEDYGRVMAALNHHAETGEPYNVDYRIIRKDGSLRNWIDRGLVIYDEEGKITRSVGACVDITEHRQAEARAKIRRDLAIKLAGRIDMQTALRHCLDAAIEISGFDTGVIYVLDEKNGDLKAACGRGSSAFLEEHYTVLKDGTPDARLIKRGLPIYARAEEFTPPFDEQLKPEGFTFDATIPVLFQDRVIASLGIFSHTQNNLPVVIRDSLEAIAADIGIIIDRISYRQALQASEERYRFITDNTVDVIWMLDKHLNYTFISPSVTRLNGFSVEEAMSRGIAQRMTPASLDKIVEALEKGSIPTLDGTPGQKHWFTLEMETYHKDGSTIWMETSMALINDASGEFNGMLGTSRDISTRRQAEQALRDSEEKYRLVVENAREAIFVAQDGVMKFANLRTTGMIGYQQKDLSSKPFSDFIHPDDREFVIERHLRRLRGEIFEAGYPFRVVRSDGQVLWVEIQAVLIEWEGRPATLNFITDITERRHSEERGRIRRDLALSLIGITDVETASMLCLDAAINSSGFDSGVVYLHDEETDAFNAICHRGVSESLVQHLSALQADSKWARLIMKGRPLYLKAEDFTSPYKEQLGPEGLSFTATIPVLHREQVLASLGVYSHTLKDMPDVVRNSLEAIGADIGIVIERIRTRHELQQSQERYNVIAENTSDVIWSADKYLNYNYFSPSVYKQRGYTPQEMLQFKMDQVVAASSMEPVISGVASAISQFESHPGSGPVTYTGEMEVYCKDGSTIWTETSFTVVGDEQGKFNGVFGISRDITQRRRAEKALIESEIKYRSMVETSSSGVAVANETGNLILVNDKLCQIYGFGKDEVMGRQFFDFVHPDDREKIITDFMEAVDKSQTLPALEFRGVRKDGSTIWLFTSPSALVIEGHLTGFSVIVQDITQLKQAEEALKESEQRYRSLFDHNPAMTYALDRSGRFTSVNATAIRKSGYTEEEALTMNFSQVVAPEYIETVKNNFVKALNGEPQLYEATMITRDGNRIDINITSTPIITDGRVIGIYGIAEDITGRKKSAKDLKMALQKASSTLDGTIEAIAMMSELRDPYTAGHQRRVSQLAVAIATEIGMEHDRIEDLGVAGLLHDVGKVYVPSEILSKPGKLTDLELGLAKAHAEASYNIVRSIKFSGPIAHIVWQHHERMDGSGYPRGLMGDQIMLEARILAVADVVEAMSSHRPYRPALGVEKALGEIISNRDVLYDAQAVDACLVLFREKGFRFQD